jgi:hypothetical protein
VLSINVNRRDDHLKPSTSSQNRAGVLGLDGPVIGQHRASARLRSTLVLVVGLISFVLGRLVHSGVVGHLFATSHVIDTLIADEDWALYPCVLVEGLEYVGSGIHALKHNLHDLNYGIIANTVKKGVERRVRVLNSRATNGPNERLTPVTVLELVPVLQSLANTSLLTRINRANNPLFEQPQKIFSSLSRHERNTIWPSLEGKFQAEAGCVGYEVAMGLANNSMRGRRKVCFREGRFACLKRRRPANTSFLDLSFRGGFRGGWFNHVESATRAGIRGIFKAGGDETVTLRIGGLLRVSRPWRSCSRNSSRNLSANLRVHDVLPGDRGRPTCRTNWDRNRGLDRAVPGTVIGSRHRRIDRRLDHVEGPITCTGGPLNVERTVGLDVGWPVVHGTVNRIVDRRRERGALSCTDCLLNGIIGGSWSRKKRLLISSVRIDR